MNVKQSIRRNTDKLDTYDNQICSINVEQILPNPVQPRCDFDDVEIVSMADSIRKHGLLHPITVREAGSDEYGNTLFELIAGERRLRAVKMLGKKHIPCIVLEASELESAQLAVVENIMRKNLNMFEFALALESMMNIYNITQEGLASKMSTSQPNIANKLRLLKFTQSERELILANSLSERHARALLRIKDESERRDALLYIISHEYSVKKAEAYIEDLLSPQNDSETVFRKVDRLYATAKNLVDDFNASAEIASAGRYETDDEIRIVIRIAK